MALDYTEAARFARHLGRILDDPRTSQVERDLAAEDFLAAVKRMDEPAKQPKPASLPTYNHTRGDSQLHPCDDCAAHPGHRWLCADCMRPAACYGGDEESDTGGKCAMHCDHSEGLCTVIGVQPAPLAPAERTAAEQMALVLHGLHDGMYHYRECRQGRNASEECLCGADKTRAATKAALEAWRAAAGATPAPASPRLILLASQGGHAYPDLDGTVDCASGCGAWMGPHRSGGPDPFGRCPRAGEKGGGR